MREKKQTNIEIGEQIKLARENAKITQEALAERVDVSPQYISDLERGVVGVSIPTLKKICVALNASSDQILFGEVKAGSYAPVFSRMNSLSERQFTLLCEIIERYISAIDEPRQTN